MCVWFSLYSGSYGSLCIVGAGSGWLVLSVKRKWQKKKPLTPPFYSPSSHLSWLGSLFFTLFAVYTCCTVHLQTDNILLRWFVSVHDDRLLGTIHVYAQ